VNSAIFSKQDKTPYVFLISSISFIFSIKFVLGFSMIFIYSGKSKRFILSFASLEESSEIEKACVKLGAYENCFAGETGKAVWLAGFSISQEL